jgi:hypothetical protein
LAISEALERVQPYRFCQANKQQKVVVERLSAFYFLGLEKILSFLELFLKFDFFVYGKNYVMDHKMSTFNYVGLDYRRLD